MTASVASDSPAVARVPRRGGDVAGRSAPAQAELWVSRLGIVDYERALAIQERVRRRRQQDELPDVLLLLEHPPVYTRGRRSDPSELPMDVDWYRARGIEIVDTDRGGRVTYHGPGQLVGYPIVRVSDVVAYVRTIEAAIVAALADEGIVAARRAGLTGVWVRGADGLDRKIASIGVHVSRGVTTHGFAVNVHNDLEPFSWVIPCGIEGVQMTSIARETGGLPARPDALACFSKRMAWHLSEALGRRQRLLSPRRLG